MFIQVELLFFFTFLVYYKQYLHRIRKIAETSQYDTFKKSYIEKLNVMNDIINNILA
jgi:hypothetical protein